MEFRHGNRDVVPMIKEEEENMGLHSNHSIFQCRICHEEEEGKQRSTTMESPCACSGTAKFAHRNCIQRWCDEKGSILCEICLQKYEPGYTVVPTAKTKEIVLDIAETNNREDGRIQIPTTDDEDGDEEYIYCSPPSPARTKKIMAWYRSIAATLTILLLMRHLICIISLENTHKPLILLFIFCLRASGILLPFYLLMRVISNLHLVPMQRQ